MFNFIVSFQSYLIHFFYTSFSFSSPIKTPTDNMKSLGNRDRAVTIPLPYFNLLVSQGK